MKTFFLVAMLLGAGWAEAKDLLTVGMPPNQIIFQENNGRATVMVSGKRYVMLEDSASLISAAEGVLPYLRPSDEPISMSITLEYRTPLTPIEQLEKEIRDTKARDAAIKRFRDALEKAKR